MSTSPLCFDQYVVDNVEGTRFLDVGCGLGKWGFLLRKYRPTPGGPAVFVAGFDPFAPHLVSLNNQGVYDSLVMATGACLPFADGSFDFAVACEVLEHMDVDAGVQLISELRRVVRRGFVVTTPNFKCLRGGGETVDGYNEFEAHRHIYSYREFRALGLTQVIGVGRLQIRPYRLGVALASLGLYFPRRSRYLMGFWFADGAKRVLV